MPQLAATAPHLFENPLLKMTANSLPPINNHHHFPPLPTLKPMLPQRLGCATPTKIADNNNNKGLFSVSMQCSYSWFHSTATPHTTTTKRKRASPKTPHKHLPVLAPSKAETAPSLPIQLAHSSKAVIGAPRSVTRMVTSACEGLAKSIRPLPIEEGMGGSYFLRDASNNNVAVFKPTDEEPCAPNNPKGVQGNLGDTGIKSGVRSGEQAVREVAAFAIDRQHAVRAGVPPTVLASVAMEPDTPAKFGSMQMFIPSSGSTGDMGPSLFDHRQVQAIAVLDMRLMNADRHDGNILVCKSFADPNTGRQTLSLVPIDHGCCLPDSLEVCNFEWAWVSWPQVQGPLLPEIRDLVLSIDPDTDARILNRLAIRKACVRTMRLATRFLKACVQSSDTITLAMIAEHMSRPDFNELSTLERIVLRSRWQAAMACVVSRSNPQPKPKHATSFAVQFERAFERNVAAFVQTLPK